MVEVQDTVIKLFGKKISLPENGKTIVSSGGNSAGESSANIHHENSSSNHDCILIKMNNNSCLDAKKVGGEESQKDRNLPEESTNLKAELISKDDESDTSNSEKKTVKKPEKIVACPRCSSMDTKFCYYNNYNTNQPRHFCKSCQRYWTNGGTMRNVPVGSGRRKNKNQLSASYYLHNHTHTTVTDEESLVEVARVNSNILIPNFEPNAKLLCFESASSVFSFTDKRAPNGRQHHGILEPRNGIQDPHEVKNIHGFPYLSGLPWPYPWNSTNPVYHAPYWNCNVLGGWSNPWFQTPTINSGSSLPALGKHSRDGELLNQTNLVSPNFRIDGPDEAARSSICREGLFKGFQAKCGEKKNKIESASPVLQANPAAMSRSLSFKERA